ncbi:asparagine--tRNA ligase [Lachnoclostridium sp. Marseille-P6806]|uniref:asparagine--tRNA ligase n=1 Tax=Lachnoclostridium sp. Marseille-P6806 TaxID=2364793 RepID=UPI0010317BB1|nr:asparagine--tRNA ligase [Lachnoclostridium sp. Marseille-P6806]
MRLTEVREISQEPGKYAGQRVSVGGWVRSNRDSRSIGFLVIADGSCFAQLQIVYSDALDGTADGAERETPARRLDFAGTAKLNVGAAVIVTGVIVETPEAKQPFEMQAEEVFLEGASAPEYPLQKKRHTLEYLRTMPHLRPRTNTFQAVFRVRSVAAFAIHQFFQQQDFVYVHTPLITASDAEGAGEMFQVTTLPLESVPRREDGAVDYSQDFFGKKTSLTVSGQLNGEAFATAFRNIYTFGPTFRAEQSNTTRHAAEFWMIEPEMCFADLGDYMDCAEAMLKYMIRSTMEQCPQEMQFFNSFVDRGLIERLTNVVESDFGRISYTDAVALLEKHNDEFDFKVYWGCDLQTEHERYLTEQVFRKPVFVTDYPKEIKAFYMKQNPDGRTVAAADCLVPGIGEIIGGSQREDDLERLTARMDELGMEKSDYQFYLDLRRFGSVRHSGFGLGFERAVMYLTGMGNIRDVALFPRTFGNCEL